MSWEGVPQFLLEWRSEEGEREGWKEDRNRCAIHEKKLPSLHYQLYSCPSSTRILHVCASSPVFQTHNRLIHYPKNKAKKCINLVIYFFVSLLFPRLVHSTFICLTHPIRHCPSPAKRGGYFYKLWTISCIQHRAASSAEVISSNTYCVLT